MRLLASKKIRSNLEHQRQSHLVSIKEESAEEGRQLLRMLKLLPLIVLYSIHVSSIYKSEGILSASVAWLWIISLVFRWPKGYLKQAVMVVLFGVILPFIVLPYFSNW